MSFVTVWLMGAALGFFVGSVFALNVVWHRHGWRPQ